MYPKSFPKISQFSLSSFNSFVLTTLIKDFRLGSDPRSLVRRHQTLSIIYANISLTLMVVLYEAASLLLGMHYHLSPPVMIMPCIISSFICLRIGKNDMAAVFLLIYAQGINFFVSHYRHSSVGAVACIFMFPNFSFFITSSITVQFINAGISLAQTLFHFTSIWKAFSITLTQEQSDEISHLMTSSFPCLALLCMMLIAQKRVENLIWQTAHMTHEKMEQINLEIMQAVQAKDSFISNLSHEIRNPLNAMNGSINYLLSVARDPQSQRVLTNAKISGETLLNLFNNLLDAAKMKSEKMELSYSDMNLRETFKKALIINCENIKAKKIFVDVLINKSLPQIIRSDSARLLQILMNLLSNAIKFTSEGGKIIISATLCPKDTPTEILTSQMIPQSTLEQLTQRDRRTSHEKIESLTDEFTREEAEFRSRNFKNIRLFESKALEYVRLNQNDMFDKKQPWSIQEVDINAEGHKDLVLPNKTGINLDNYFLKIQVTDTGCGIAEENIPKLFEMFTQAHRSVTSSHGGTGLGLWICKQLCQKMGGEIKLYSKLGTGTTFVFYLPVTNEEDQIEHFEIDTSRPHSDKISCLVVDDYNYNRELYKLLFEREGVQVCVASNGEEAINKYRGNQGKFDLVLMDVQMPKVDGFTAARKIRELEVENHWRRSDLYFVSGEYFDEKEMMASFKVHGGNTQTLGIKCLKKPIDIDVIARLTSKYTRKGK